MIFNQMSVGGGGGGVETVEVSLYSVGIYMPDNIYYTDENMEMQHEISGSVVGVQMPVGSIVFCLTDGPVQPAGIPASPVGLTQIYVYSGRTGLYAAYEVTG